MALNFSLQSSYVITYLYLLIHLVVCNKLWLVLSMLSLLRTLEKVCSANDLSIFSLACLTKGLLTLFKINHPN